MFVIDGVAGASERIFHIPDHVLTQVNSANDMLAGPPPVSSSVSVRGCIRRCEFYSRVPLAECRFRGDQLVISCIAGAVPICPPCAEVKVLFGCLGSVIPLDNEE